MDVKKFMEKDCHHTANKKDALGSAEIRKIWDSIDQKHENVQNLNRSELRTFVMAVFQHKTFCRFSDLSVVKLDDILYDVDYFSVKIRCSKTDQGGKGQMVFMPKASSNLRDPHMLMCLYLHTMGFDDIPDGESVYLFPPLK
jgi:hypothetical protein